VLALLGTRRGGVGRPLDGDDDRSIGVGAIGPPSAVPMGASAGEDVVEDMPPRLRLPDFVLPILVDGVGDMGSRLRPSEMGGMAGEALDSDESSEGSDLAWDWELCRRLARPELSRRTVTLLPVESRLPAGVGWSPM
jgi:hypothetical protein